MKKTKILYFFHGSYLNGGASMSLVEVLRKLATHKGYEILVAIVDNAEEDVRNTINELKIKTIKVSRWNFSIFGRFLIGYLYFNPRTLVSLLRDLIQSTKNINNYNRVIKEFKPDIIHFNSITLLPLAYFCSTKAISIVHCREGHRKYPFRRFREYLIRLFQLKVAHFICISEVVKKQIQPSLSLPTKSTVISNPIATRKFYRKIVKGDCPVIAYFGGYQTTKGCIELLEALKLVNKKLKILFCGPTGSLQNDIVVSDNLIMDIEKKALHDFKKLGLVKDPLLIMNQADLIVVPHTKPHFSRVIIEAWSLKKRVLAFEDAFTTLLKEKSQGALYLSDNKSAESLAKSLDHIVSQSTVDRSVVEKGFNYWHENHEPKKVFWQLNKLYQKALLGIYS